MNSFEIIQFIMHYFMCNVCKKRKPKVTFDRYRLTFGIFLPSNQRNLFCYSNELAWNNTFCCWRNIIISRIWSKIHSTCASLSAEVRTKAVMHIQKCVCVCIPDWNQFWILCVCFLQFLLFLPGFFEILNSVFTFCPSFLWKKKK